MDCAGSPAEGSRAGGGGKIHCGGWWRAHRNENSEDRKAARASEDRIAAREAKTEAQREKALQFQNQLKEALHIWNTMIFYFVSLSANYNHIAMKHLLKAFAVLLFAAAACACSLTNNDDAKFEESFLYGKWQSGTLYYTYASDHTGTTWDEADDVSESEATRFEWELVNSDLTHIYVTEVNTYGTKASIPKVYTVITLTPAKLVYEDSYGKEFVFSKVN